MEDNWKFPIKNSNAISISYGNLLKKTKIIKIEYLYLDLATCDRCIGTDAVLEQVLEVIRPALQLAGYTVDYRKVEIQNVQLAEQYHFLSSPTICVNGHDICQTVQENDCVCCGEISGTSVTCRIFAYDGKMYEVPPKEMLAESILRSIFAADLETTVETQVYTLPENLKNFFEGKAQKAACCSCGSDCC